MQLFVIGPERSAPVAVGLARKTAVTLVALQAASASRLIVHRDVELPRGWDQLGLVIVTRALRASPTAQEGWFREKPQDAVLHVDMAVRALQMPKNPPERPSQGAFIRHFRENVLGTTQNVLGAIAGAAESTVSRWEAGDLLPDVYALYRLREFARASGLPWEDRWVFEAP